MESRVVPTYPLAVHRISVILPSKMFLRAKLRKKDGKPHRYFSVVENRRVGQKRMAQRTVLYLGEINDGQEAAWRKSLEVFDESSHQYSTLSIFPEDREIPAEASNTLQVKLSEMQLRRPRIFGNCWLGCELWRQLQLQEFWQEKLAAATKRETVPWEKVLRLLVVNRLIEPGSEFRLHRHWFDQSAMAELLEADFAVAEKDRLYRCLDRLLEHQSALFAHLRQRWQDLFQAQFDVLLYDLTSTYIEGEGEAIPKARYGYSRDQRFDCKQVVIALVITPEGFPLAYEVMEGNTSDKTTLRAFLEKIKETYGQARRVWLMDRGIPTEAVLAEMRAGPGEVFYLVGTGRSKIRQYEKKWLDLPWQKVREAKLVGLHIVSGSLGKRGSGGRGSDGSIGIPARRGIQIAGAFKHSSRVESPACSPNKRLVHILAPWQSDVGANELRGFHGSRYLRSGHKQDKSLVFLGIRDCGHQHVHSSRCLGLVGRTSKG